MDFNAYLCSVKNDCLTINTDAMKELIEIQQRLKSPKDLNNSFGGYKYRSCEKILENLKPILGELGCTCVFNDDVCAVGNMVFVKTTLTLTNASGESVSTNAFARHDDSKRGMDGSQITGAASSYARKYALNAMFAIDDTKDADTDEFRRTRDNAQTRYESDIKKLCDMVKQCNTMDDLRALRAANEYYKDDQRFRDALNERASVIKQTPAA